MNMAAFAKLEERQILQFLDSLEIELPPSIVDVGGNLNAEISAPYVLKGWRSLIIDPQRQCVEALRAKFMLYTNAKIVECACSDAPGELKLFIGVNGPGSEVSTLSTRSDPWMDQVRSDQFEMVTVKTLTSVLEENDFPGDIGVLKIDTESWDYNVLLGLDFSKYKPRVIVTEEYYWDIQGTINKHIYLEDNNYVNLGYIGNNSIWVHRDCGPRHSLSVLRGWLTAIGRYPKVQGRPDLALLSPDMKLEGRHTRAAELNNVLIQASPLNALGCGQAETLSVAVINWLDTPIRRLKGDGSPIELSYYWLYSSGKAAVGNGVRTPLERDVEAGAAVKQNITVRAPTEPGRYILIIDLFDEHDKWCGDQGGTVARQEVLVVEA